MTASTAWPSASIHPIWLRIHISSSISAPIFSLMLATLGHLFFPFPLHFLPLHAFLLLLTTSVVGKVVPSTATSTSSTPVALIQVARARASFAPTGVPAVHAMATSWTSKYRPPSFGFFSSEDLPEARRTMQERIAHFMLYP